MCLDCDGQHGSSAVPRPRKPNLSEVHTRLTSARAAWRAALAEYEIAEEIYLSLPTNNADGSTALRSANQRLHRAAEEFKAAMSTYLDAGGKRESALPTASGLRYQLP